MSKREKILERFRQNPKNVRFHEMETLLLGFGFEKRQPGTSHATFFKGMHQVTIPFHQPFIRKVYVLEVLKIIALIEDELDED